MKKYFYFFLFVTGLVPLFGQIPFAGKSGIRFNVFTGHHFAANVINKTNQSLDGKVSGFDIGLVQCGLRNDSFTAIYGTPRLGLDARFINMNSTDTFGYCLALLPTFEIEIIHRKLWSLQSKIAYGINFNTKQFNERTNFDNRAISSPVNFAFDIGLLFHTKLNAHIEVNLGAGLYHVSNGSLKMPNGGINIVYINTGISYYPKLSIQQAYKKPNYKLTGKRLYFMGYAAFAYREQGYFNYVRRFWVFSAVNQFMFPINKLYSLGAGIDGFYDATQPLINNYTDRLADVPEYKKYYLAVGFTNRFDIGKVFIPVGIYRYVYNKAFVKEPVYIRFGLGLQLNKYFFIGSFFKGTITKDLKLQSDFMEWCLGVRL